MNINFTSNLKYDYNIFLKGHQSLIINHAGSLEDADSYQLWFINPQ